MLKMLSIVMLKVPVKNVINCDVERFLLKMLLRGSC